jgi:hypothetical protein
MLIKFGFDINIKKYQNLLKAQLSVCLLLMPFTKQMVDEGYRSLLPYKNGISSYLNP